MKTGIPPYYIYMVQNQHRILLWLFRSIGRNWEWVPDFTSLLLSSTILYKYIYILQHVRRTIRSFKTESAEYNLFLYFFFFFVVVTSSLYFFSIFGSLILFLLFVFLGSEFVVTVSYVRYVLLFLVMRLGLPVMWRNSERLKKTQKQKVEMSGNYQALEALRKENVDLVCIYSVTPLYVCVFRGFYFIMNTHPMKEGFHTGFMVSSLIIFLHWKTDRECR